MRKFVLFFVCIGLTSFTFSQVPVPAPPPPPLLPPPPKPKHEYLLSNSSVELEWRGTAEEAERAFTTSLEDEVDVVRDRESKKTITGYLTILDTNGKPQGKVELKDGKLHGEEIFYDEDGNIVEENYWIEGKLSKTPPPRLKKTKLQNNTNDSTNIPSNPFLVPTSPLSLANPWSDFIYDSPEEKAFWDKVPDWTDKYIEVFFDYEWYDSNGSEVDENSSDLYTGYSKWIAHTEYIMHIPPNRALPYPVAYERCSNRQLGPLPDRLVETAVL